METIAGLGLVALIVAYWFDALRTRERASNVARQVCRRLDCQFLDDTVACTRTRLVRHHSRLLLRRDYDFEFAGVDATRRPGRLVMLGVELISLRLDDVEQLQ